LTRSIIQNLIDISSAALPQQMGNAPDRSDFLKYRNRGKNAGIL